MKTAISIISDPKGGEEALARLFNALKLASAGKEAGDQVEISFIGTGTRWPAELSKLEHPANALYNEVRENVVGASRSCATKFGANDGLSTCGVESTEVKLHKYQSEGWNLVVF